MGSTPIYNIPFADPTDLVRDWPQLSEDVADAVEAAVAGVPVLAGIGSNVVQTVKPDVFAASVDSGDMIDITGLDVTITPTSATSKVLLVVQVTAGQTSNAGGTHFKILRGSTPVGVADADGARQRASAATGGMVFGGSTSEGEASRSIQTAVISLLDSPETTSPVTYKVQVGHTRTFGGTTVHVNRARTDSDSTTIVRTVSSITAIEVAA